MMQLSELIVSSDKSKLDRNLILEQLRDSYWAQNIPAQTVQTSIENSLCYGAYYQDRQLAYARVVTDQATFAYLADVFVLEAYRGLGIGNKLVEAVLADERTSQVRRFMLATRDAHGVYESFGFKTLDAVEAGKMMQIRPVTKYPALND